MPSVQEDWLELSNTLAERNSIYSDERGMMSVCLTWLLNEYKELRFRMDGLREMNYIATVGKWTYTKNDNGTIWIDNWEEGSSTQILDKDCMEVKLFERVNELETLISLEGSKAMAIKAGVQHTCDEECDPASDFIKAMRFKND